MGGEGYARDRAESSNSALLGAQVRSKAIRARSETPRRWPSGTGGSSTRRLLGSMGGAIVLVQLAGRRGVRMLDPTITEPPRPSARGWSRYGDFNTS